MGLDDLEQRLASHDEEFKTVPAAEGGNVSYDWPPDGTYQALVRMFDFFEGKENGVAYLKVELEIALHDEYEGRGVDVIRQLEPRPGQSAEQWKQSLSFLKKDLLTLGIDVDQVPLSAIRPGSPVLNDLLDVPVEIAIKTGTKADKDGNPYRNIYINERLGGPMRAPKPAAPTETTPAQPATPAVSGQTPVDEIAF